MSLTAASFLSIYRFKKLDIASKIFGLSILFSFVIEIISYYVAKKYHTNEALYAIYELVAFGLTSLYFNYSVDFFKKIILVYISV